MDLQRLDRAGYSIELFVPDARGVRDGYLSMKESGLEPAFPHWARLWPAALAMGDLIFQRPSLVKGMRVLELAAGLGLPSFVAARYAASVCCSDYMEEAVAVMERSVAHLGLLNVSCRVLDWNELPSGLSCDVLVLSDINYDPSEFDRLFGVLEGFLLRGATVLLSTPQRLMAKPFIERLLPFCREQVEMFVEDVAVSLLVLSAI